MDLDSLTITPSSTNSVKKPKPALLPFHNASSPSTLSPSKEDKTAKQATKKSTYWLDRQFRTFKVAFRKNPVKTTMKVVVPVLGTITTASVAGYFGHAKLQANALAKTIMARNAVCRLEKPGPNVKAFMIQTEDKTSPLYCPATLEDNGRDGAREWYLDVRIPDSKGGPSVYAGQVQRDASWDTNGSGSGRWNYNPAPNATLWSGGYTEISRCRDNPYDKVYKNKIGPSTDFDYLYTPDKPFDSPGGLSVNATGYAHDHPGDASSARIIAIRNKSGKQTYQDLIPSPSTPQNLTDNEVGLTRYKGLKPAPQSCEGISNYKKLKRMIRALQSEKTEQTVRKTLMPYRPPLVGPGVFKSS